MKPSRFLVIEDSGLGHAFTNAQKEVTAKDAVEAALKVTKCPIKMVAEKGGEKGVWEVFDEASHLGWSGITDEAHIKTLEKLVKLGFYTKHSWPEGHPRHGEPPSYSPINQWMVTVVKR